MTPTDAKDDTLDTMMAMPRAIAAANLALATNLASNATRMWLQLMTAPLQHPAASAMLAFDLGRMVERTVADVAAPVLPADVPAPGKTKAASVAAETVAPAPVHAIPAVVKEAVTKPVDAKPLVHKAPEAKAPEAKAVEPKPVEAKPVPAKPEPVTAAPAAKTANAPAAAKVAVAKSATAEPAASKAVPATAGPAKAEPAKGEPAKGEPAKPVAAKAAPAKAAPPKPAAPKAMARTRRATVAAPVPESHPMAPSWVPEAALVFDDAMVTPKAPLLLTKRPAQPDDLTAIKGIGGKLARLLNDLGVWQYGQIAGWSPEEVAWINDKLDFKGRVQRERWVQQARALVKA